MDGWLVGQCCLAATTVRMSQESVKKRIFLIIFSYFSLVCINFKLSVIRRVYSLLEGKEREREKQC